MPMQGKDINEIKRKGRQLSVVSSLIIVFIITGAEFSEKGMLGGAFIEFKNVDYLYYAATLVFFYSIIQFFVHSGNPFPKIKDEAKESIVGHEMYKRTVEKIAYRLYAANNLEWNETNKNSGDKPKSFKPNWDVTNDKVRRFLRKDQELSRPYLNVTGFQHEKIGYCYVPIGKCIWHCYARQG